MIVDQDTSVVRILVGGVFLMMLFSCQRKERPTSWLPCLPNMSVTVQGTSRIEHFFDRTWSHGAVLGNTIRSWVSPVLTLISQIFLRFHPLLRSCGDEALDTEDATSNVSVKWSG
jgi:hypothetical protein